MTGVPIRMLINWAQRLRRVFDIDISCWLHHGAVRRVRLAARCQVHTAAFFARGGGRQRSWKLAPPAAKRRHPAETGVWRLI